MGQVMSDIDSTFDFFGYDEQPQKGLVGLI